MQPKPVEWFEIENEEEVDYYRNINCEFYVICLNRADKEEWEGWHCRNCPFFNKK